MINIAYFSNQFISAKGHGIARYSKSLHKNLINDYKEYISLFPVSASSHNSKRNIDLITEKTGHKILPLGRILTPIAWQILDFPHLENYFQHKIDLVHNLSLTYPISTKKSLISTIHDIGPLTHPKFFSKKDNYFMRLGFKQILNSSDKIICVSNYTANSVEYYAKKKYGQSIQNRISIIYEGVDHQFENIKEPSTIDAPDFVKELCKKPFFLSVGQISARKNINLIIESLIAAKQDLSSHNLLIVGNNSKKIDTLLKKYNSDDFSKKIINLGYVKDKTLKYLYNKATAFIYPSLFEGFGLPIIEAMKCGCPVITSNSTSLNEIASDACIQINPESLNELKEQMIIISNDKKYRDLLISKGLQRAKSFTWSKCAELTYHEYCNLV